MWTLNNQVVNAGLIFAGPTLYVAPIGGCWRRTWGTADTGGASLLVFLRFLLLVQVASQSWSSSTEITKIRETFCEVNFDIPVKILRCGVAGIFVRCYRFSCGQLAMCIILHYIAARDNDRPGQWPGYVTEHRDTGYLRSDDENDQFEVSHYGLTGTHTLAQTCLVAV